jgi:1,4-alpha-glucan branching enzyme
MTSGTMVEYAVKRTKDHLHRFNTIYGSIGSDNLDTEWLANLERRNNLFPDINFRVYCD